MISREDGIDLARRVLTFANLKEIRSARQVEGIFSSHRFAGFIWNYVPGPRDVRGFKVLQSELKTWLSDSRNSEKDRTETIAMALRRFKTESAEQAVILKKTKDGRMPAVSLWGFPEVGLSRGETVFTVHPFVSGVLSAVFLGTVLLLSQYNHVLTTCEICGNLYLRSRTLRAACSRKCAKGRRIRQVAAAVKKFRHRLA